MSEIFHKSCYTSRSSGYKYRTLSTNTGDRKRRTSKEENTFEKKFRELSKEITSRISKQLDDTQTTREQIQDKYCKINAKIDSVIELQHTVLGLRQQLRDAEAALTSMTRRVNRMDSVYTETSPNSLRSLPIFERLDEREYQSSTVTHI